MQRIILALALLLSVESAPARIKSVRPERVGMDPTLLSKADSVLEDAVARENIPGAVLAVVRQGKLAYLKAYGHRSVVPQKTPMTTDVIFDMASCSKSLGTALCVMKLVEDGILQLDAPVSRYLPEFQNYVRDGGEDTIRLVHLLTHTSGLPAYASVESLRRTCGAPNPDGLMQHIATCKRNSAPGTRMTYSCLNFITLQNVVQRTSGLSLRQFAQKHIFGPLGLKHTDYMPCQTDSAGRWINVGERPVWAAKSKDRSADVLHVAPTEVQPDDQVLCGQVHDPLARVMNGGISGNAGLFTNAEDIAVICAMLQNGGQFGGVRIFREETVRMMRTVPQGFESFGRALGWDVNSGYAWNQGHHLSAAAYGHTGYTGTSVVIDPDNDLSIILLINSVHPHDDSRPTRAAKVAATDYVARACGLLRK